MTKVFSTIKQVELVQKNVLVIIALESKNQIFISYIAFFAIFDKIHLSHIALIAYLKVHNALTIVLLEYLVFENLFLPKLLAKLPKHMKSNNHIINHIDKKQPSYGLIHCLGPVELYILKTHIKTNLVNGLIRSSKFLTSAIILFFFKTLIAIFTYVSITEV